jgi:hypothetical protein
MARQVNYFCVLLLLVLLRQVCCLANPRNGIAFYANGSCSDLS